MPAAPRRRQPTLPAELAPASSPEHDLADEASLRGLELVDLDLSRSRAYMVEINQCRFSRTSLSGAVLDRASFVDCVVADCDWANLAATTSSLLRVSIRSVRLTGLHWVDGVLRSVAFQDCRMDLATFRFSSFKDVSFVGCNLARADFTSADLRGAQFIRCDLSGAQFAQANAVGARFSRCELAGIGNVTSLRGATMSAPDLAALSYAFAAALGITIESE